MLMLRSALQMVGSIHPRWMEAGEVGGLWTEKRRVKESWTLVCIPQGGSVIAKRMGALRKEDTAQQLSCADGVFD